MKLSAGLVLATITLVLGGAGSPVDAAPGPAADPPPTIVAQFRVMTYNIQHGHACCSFNAAYDLGATIDRIATHHPAIIGIQEINRNYSLGNCQDQPKVIADGLTQRLGTRYGYRMGQNREVSSTCGTGHTGNAIVSRYPLDWVANYPLPSKRGGAQRALLYVRANIEGVWVRVYVTHLEHEDVALRQQQARAALDLIGSISDGRVMLLGDLNSEPSGAIHSWIRYQGFRDAWLSVPGGAEGNPNTWRADGNPPAARIDFVYLGHRFPVRDAGVPVAPTESDHRPVRVDVNLLG